MIKYRSKKEEREFNSPQFCPVLFRKIHVMAGIAERGYGLDLLITSTSRSDGSSHDPKNSLDGRIRAVDIRVRDPYTGKRVISFAQAKELKEYHDVRLRKHGNYDSFFEHDVGRGPHIHSQTPKNLVISLK